MALITCPYCNMEISLSSVEAEDGYCPECGAVLTSSSIFNENDEEDLDENDELDGEDFDDEDFEFEDEEDFEDFDYDDFDDDEELE